MLFFRMKEERPSSLENCVAVAGFSLGEITALTFAGVFTFEDGEFERVSVYNDY